MRGSTPNGSGDSGGVRQGDARRPREAELHATATRLFRERGFHATSMQDLAEALGMNRGSLYHYIDSKDDLLWAIVTEALVELRGTVEPALARDASPATRLRAAIAGHLAFAAAHGDELSLVQIELRSLSTERRTAVIALRDAYESLWREAIEDAVAEGSLRLTDVRLAGIAILSACNWFTQWYRPDGPLTVDEIAAAFGDLYLCDAASDAAGLAPAGASGSVRAQPVPERPGRERSPVGEGAA